MADLRKSPPMLAGFFLMLKPGDLHKEVGRAFSVASSFWGEDNCPPEDWSKEFAAKVVEVVLLHKFTGIGLMQPRCGSRSPARPPRRSTTRRCGCR